MSDQICPYCGNPETTGDCGCPRFIYPNAGYLPQGYGPVAGSVSGCPNIKFAIGTERYQCATRDRRIAELEAEVAKGRRVLTKSLANFNRKHRAHRQALAALLVANVRLRADAERLDWLEEIVWSDRVGNGLALFPFEDADGGRFIGLMDIGDEDGSSMGDELENAETLRAAIDAARSK